MISLRDPETLDSGPGVQTGRHQTQRIHYIVSEKFRHLFFFFLKHIAKGRVQSSCLMNFFSFIYMLNIFSFAKL